MSSSIAGRRPSSNDDGHPSSKRIRPSGENEDIGRPIEDDAAAKRKLREAGFDPDRLSEPVVLEDTHEEYDSFDSFTPMIYFSYTGDLPMCRYLLVHGTRNDLTRKCSKGFWFPMYAAALAGHVAICQWLYDNGAVKDVYRKSGGWNPLAASWTQGHVSVMKWLILNGALHGEPGGEFSISDAKYFISHVSTRYERQRYRLPPEKLKSWVLDTNASYEAFRVFLMGTLPLRADTCIATLQSILSRNLHSEKAARLIIDKTAPEYHMVLLHEISPQLHVLGGFPDILELVADFVGIVKRRRVWDRLRDLAAFFEMHPTRQRGESESDDGSECLFELEGDVEVYSSADEDDSDVSSSSP